MDARYSKRLTLLVVLSLVTLIAIGLWQAYGVWALSAVVTYVA